MHKKKEKTSYLIFKIYFKKAYDKVYWDFLWITITEFGFMEQIINLIINCTIKLSLKWNSENLESFAPRRGLR